MDQNSESPTRALRRRSSTYSVDIAETGSDREVWTDGGEGVVDLQQIPESAFSDRFKSKSGTGIRFLEKGCFGAVYSENDTYC